MKPRLLVTAVTSASLGLSGVLSVVWFLTSEGDSRFEPAVQGLGLVAGLTGLVLERRAGAVERRQQTLGAITRELESNRTLLHRPPFTDAGRPALTWTVFPRLHISAVDAALTSDVLSQRGDRALVDRLHGWRDEVRTFNQQLSLAEILAFTDGSAETLRDLRHGLHAPDGPLVVIEDLLDDLLATLAS
ncbi:hypothetical protein ACQP1S_23875 [Micromonospora matsumotoense]|uniref:hypothetical protein n=1 Tax=Micromonospora matsumotoense TaxID=121616 RepID=UPI003D901046